MTSSAWPAEDSQDQEIREILVANGTRSIIERQVSQLEKSVDASFEANFGARVPQESRASVLKKADRQIHDIMQSQLGWPVLELQLIDLYKKKYSVSQLEAMHSYYESETGKAVAANSPAIDLSITQFVAGAFNSLQSSFVGISNEALGSTDQKK